MCNIAYHKTRHLEITNIDELKAIYPELIGEGPFLQGECLCCVDIIATAAKYGDQARYDSGYDEGPHDYIIETVRH